MSLLIKNGNLINPGNNKVRGNLDILVERGKIKKIGKNLKSKAGQVIDAEGKYVFPGLIDLHVHLREPGYEYKEDIASGTLAAAKGGFTTINCMPNTTPPLDCRGMVDFVNERAKESGVIRVVVTASITKGRAGKELVEMGELFAVGVRTLSDDGDPLSDAHLQRRAFEYASMFPMTIISHAEETSLSGEGVMHEGFVATQLGFKGIPSSAEEVMVARDIILARQALAAVHFAHVSTAGAIAMIKAAQKKGIPVSAEVTPHHFSLTDEAVRSFDTNTKVNPPLRGKTDVLACIKGIKDGVIGVIATDHAPHALFEKEQEYTNAPFGISGLETALALAYSELHLKHKLPLQTIIAALTVNPARIIGRPDLGMLKENHAADITIFDGEAKWQVDSTRFQSKGKNTPFNGQQLSGEVTHTIFNGKVVYERS